MKKAFVFIVTLVFAIPLYAQNLKATPYDFPDPVDTKTREISLQERKIYADDENGVYASNNFPAARLNDFKRVTDKLYVLSIDPENTPINMSPWYAFKIWSKEDKNVWLHFVYTEGRHRYIPKLSKDGEHWTPIDNSNFTFIEDGSAIMNIDLSSDTLWVAAQEILDTRRVGDWCEDLAKDERVTFSTIGKSKKGRDMFSLDMNNGKTKKKDIIAIFSRQHPPEVTGFLALQAFLDELMVNDQSEVFFNKYRVVVYPLLNPDGVDEGHWRHNTGGIDLNRDWAYYNQPETRAVADNLVNVAASAKARVVLGLDFHSTQKDIFYTLPDDGDKSIIPWFKRPWLDGIEASIDNYELNEGPSNVGQPVSKGWFYTQFKAEGVTYEVGDETPRDFIELKGRVAAQQMIKVLLDHKD
jgi:hypothetical protein